MRDLDFIAVEQVRCHVITCHANPGLPCITSSGAKATRVHEGRKRALEAAWRVGHTSGLTFALSLMNAKLDPDKAHADIYADIERVKTLIGGWIR
jgi:hypothetical protein